MAGASTKRTTVATQRSKCASLPIRCALANRWRRSCSKALGLSPNKIAQMPLALLATSIDPSEQALVAKRISLSVPPAR